jgi:type I restriction enzyme M protein
MPKLPDPFSTKPTKEQIKTTREILDAIFKDPQVKYGLKEFSDIKLEEVLNIFEKEKGRFYIRCLKRDKDIFIFDKNAKKGKPEEIIRQLWLYKLITQYSYPVNQIKVEENVYFGREIKIKDADIVVYHKDKVSPFIVIETKKPDEKKGLAQVKSYASSMGALIAVWTNGQASQVLYRLHPSREYEYLTDIPKNGESVEDLKKKKLVLADLKRDYDLTERLKILQELVFASTGESMFNEVFKLIYAKIHDEIEARDRKDNELKFRVYFDDQQTKDEISILFEEAKEKYEGVFEKQDRIKLSASLLKACISKLQDIAILNKNTRIADEAFEFLLPDVAKAQKGQYFTPRYVIKAAVKMLNPKQTEYIIDPACGSGGFLIEAMRWVWDNYLQDKPESKKIEYAQRYIYGLDFEEMMHKISRALMTIAGDGSSNIFRLNTLDTKSWFEETEEKLEARKKLKKLLLEFRDYKTDKENQESFRYFNFDILLTNPPFAGEIHDPALIREYELTKNKKGGYPDKVERDLLFIERELQFIKPGGRMVTVLPQGKLNNTNTEYIRKWLMDKARILAVVGLHTNTFKLPSPAKGTSTKTSLLFLQKWNDNPELGPLNPYQEDYPIFMAASKKPGKNNSGEYIYKKDVSGQFIKDDGNLIIDTDLDDIAESFVKFAKEQKFSFWE